MEESQHSSQRRHAEMGDTQAIRASDRDRQQVVDRLRGAVGDGRLRMDEYMERMELAYQAVTYGDLAPLQAALPAAGSTSEPAPVAAPATAAPVLPARQPSTAGPPAALRALFATGLPPLPAHPLRSVPPNATT